MKNSNQVTSYDVSERTADTSTIENNKPRKPTPRWNGEQNSTETQSAEGSGEFSTNIDTIVAEGAGELPGPALFNASHQEESSPVKKEGKHAAKVKESRRFCGTGSFTQKKLQVL